MFANSYQSGFISIFYSVGSNPLALWDKQVKNGHIRRMIDDEVKSLVLEISGSNVATTYITCPIKPRASLGIKLPFLVMVIKNMKKYFTFEIQILDDKDMHRRFRVSNFQSTTKVRPFCTTMPIGLGAGWNQVQFNLADFTKRAYGSTYVETMRVQIHANVRVRRLYFSDTLYSEEEMPNEFKLFAPVSQKKKQLEAKSSKEMTKEHPQHSTVPKLQAEEIPPPPSPIEEEVKIPVTPTEIPVEPKHSEVVQETSKKQDIEGDVALEKDEPSPIEKTTEEAKGERKISKQSEHLSKEGTAEPEAVQNEDGEHLEEEKTEVPLEESDKAAVEDTLKDKGEVQATPAETIATSIEGDKPEETTAAEQTTTEEVTATEEHSPTEPTTTDEPVADEPTTSAEPTIETLTETDKASTVE